MRIRASTSTSAAHVSRFAKAAWISRGRLHHIEGASADGDKGKGQGKGPR